MEYPPPEGITNIFNPDQFPQTFSLLQQFINAGLGTFLTFPVAQGNQSWIEGGFSFTLGAEGLEYNGTTTTWANLQTKILAIQALSQASNATTLNVNNAVRIQNGETEPSPLLQYIQLIADTDGHNKLSLSGSVGTSNQVLASGGLNGSLAWVTQSGGVATYGTLAQTLNEGAIADRDIDLDNNDLLNVKAIYNLDSSGFEGLMNAQKNYSKKITPYSTQGWGQLTYNDGAYTYVEDAGGSYVEMVSNSLAAAPYDRPVMEIIDVPNDAHLIINSTQIRLGTQIGGTVPPTANAFLGTDGSGDLQYVSSAPTNSTLETVLGNSSPEGDAGGKPINDCGAITFSKKSPADPTPAISISSSDVGGFPECLTINSTILTNASKDESGSYLPIIINGVQYFIPLYAD